MSNNSMSNNNMDLFRLGMIAGQKQLADYIVHQFEIGKPVELLNGNLYWLKDTKQNLMDIMDDIESTWNEEHGVNKFIVPVKMIHNMHETKREVIIQTVDAKTAMLIAIGDFEHNGWIVDRDYENYKQLKGLVKSYRECE